MKKFLIVTIAIIIVIVLFGGYKYIKNKERESEIINMNTTQINIAVNGKNLTATLENNISAKALLEKLEENPITISMSDYGNMEKVGELPTNLPTKNEKITTQAGDLILYQGKAFVIYYAPNTWNFTKLGKINNVTASELKEILGEGDVEVELSL